MMSTDRDRLLLELRNASLRDTFAEFTTRTLCWLALFPEWTDELARRLGLVTDPASLPALVDQLDRAGLVDRRWSLAADGSQHETFWLRPRTRAGVGDYLQANHFTELMREVDLLFDALDGVEVDLPAAEIWSTVGGFRNDPSGAELLSYVDRLVAGGDLVSATNAVSMARAIGDLVGGPLAEAAKRASWRLDRARRTADDLVQLRDYHPRQDIESALAEVIFGSGDKWAVHLLGAAGVGKTMIVRQLTSGRFAAGRGRPEIAVARVDFDHLDPRYPEQRPTELLQALADELVGYATGREGYARYRFFHDSADQLNEMLAGVNPDQSRRHTLLQAAVRRFAQLAEGLPQPVVLVLDTCEELAKLYPPGARAPAVDTTFELLAWLRREMTEQKKELRVVLAGRRRLVPPETAPGQPVPPDGGPRLQPRSYVDVVEVGGFTDGEARGYLDARSEVRPALHGALLARSLVADTSPPRYNPFELAGYCEWAGSDPSLSGDQLLAAPGDPYVERRIIGRIHDQDVRAALGVAAELGSFDQDLLAPALIRAGVDPAAAFAGLAAQEWVQVRHLGEDGRPRVLEVDEHLAARLRRATAKDPNAFPVDRVQLGWDAADRIDHADLTDLPAETIEAAVRLLPVDDAAHLWERINERVSQDGQWAWATQISDRVAAVETERADAGGPTVLAAILATQAAARIQGGERRGLAALWDRVRHYGPRHPDPVIRAQLLERARLGGGSPAVPSPAEPHQPLAGSVLAAAEAGLSSPDDQSGRWLPSLERLAAHRDPVIAASAELLLALYILKRADADLAAEHADRAVSLMETNETVASADWVDWVPPPHLLFRCRLVRLIVALRDGPAVNLTVCYHWRDDAIEDLDDIDAERLVAATYRFELSRQPVPAGSLIGLPRLPLPRQRPTVGIHHLVPPLVVEVADAWSVLGEPERAQRLLHATLRLAVEAGVHPDLVQECELALVRLCRRYRTTRYASVGSLAREGHPVMRAEAWLVRTLVADERPSSVRAVGSSYGWHLCHGAVLRAEHVPPVFTGWSPRDAVDVWRMDLTLLLESGLAAFQQEVAWQARREAPPLLCEARRLLATAEVIAIDSPREAVSALRLAGRWLASHGDRVGAAQAGVLAAFASARADDPAAVSSTEVLDTASLRIVGTGWVERAALALSLSGGTEFIGEYRSPEFPIPEGSPRGSTARRITASALLSALVASVRARTFLLTPMHKAAFLAASLGYAVGAVWSGVNVPASAAYFVAMLAFLTTVATRSRTIRIKSGDESYHGEENVTLTRLRRDAAGFDAATTLRVLLGVQRMGLMNNEVSYWFREISSLPRMVRFSVILPPCPVLIELNIGSEEHSRPWERLLTKKLGPLLARTVFWYRLEPGVRRAPSAEAWSESGTEYLGPRHLWRWQQPVALNMRKLLHLVGTPVNTSAGWSLRVKDVAERSSEQSSRGTIGREKIVDVDHLTTLPTVTVVLQAEPVDGKPRPLDDQCEGFLGLARIALDNGADFVFIVPAMRDGLASRVTDVVHDRLASDTAPNGSEVLRTAARIRRLIVSEHGEGRPELDLIVFARAAERA